MASVLILGGGYAGVAAARRMATCREVRVTLVDRRPAHELLTRLPDLLGGEIAAEQVRIPYDLILPRNVEIVHREVRGIDPSQLRVQTDMGDLEADWIVVTLGSVVAFGHGLGAEGRAFVMRSVDETLAIRAQLNAILAAEGNARVAIVGAGYTGTEVAGELAGRRDFSGAVSVSVIAEDSRLLPQGNARLAAIAERELRTQGVSFALSQRVQRIEPDVVVLESGREIAADLVIWATSAIAPPSVADGDWERAPDGRVRSDVCLRAIGSDRVFVVGDVAAVPDAVRGGLVPSNAQLAVRQGSLAAANVCAQIEGKPLREYRPRGLGEALKLGRTGAAEVLGVVVTGRAALAVKQAALARYLVSLGGRQLLSRYTAAPDGRGRNPHSRAVY